MWLFPVQDAPDDFKSPPSPFSSSDSINNYSKNNPTGAAALLPPLLRAPGDSRRIFQALRSWKSAKLRQGLGVLQESTPNSGSGIQREGIHPELHPKKLLQSHRTPTPGTGVACDNSQVNLGCSGAREEELEHPEPPPQAIKQHPALMKH